MNRRFDVVSFRTTDWQEITDFLTFYPLSSKDYAEVLVKRATTADTPLTIGIFGRWGSGKTSLMRLRAISLGF